MTGVTSHYPILLCHTPVELPAATPAVEKPDAVNERAGAASANPVPIN